MNRRALGRTDLSVSEISLGCSGFWGNRSFSEKSAVDIVRHAYELGINLFDTGHNYSNYNAEPRLGRALRDLIKSEGRSSVVVSTKAGTVRPRYWRRRDTRLNKNFDPDYIEAACGLSLKNLQVDHIDIFQLHGIKKDDITDELLSRLDCMKRRGMFRYLGANTHVESDMRAIAARSDLFDLVLIDANVLQLDRESVIADLRSAGIGVLIGTVLAQGHLIEGKIGGIRSVPDLWYLARAVVRPESRALKRVSGPMREALASIAEMTPAQSAMAYMLLNAHISSCVFGTTSLANLREVSSAWNRRLSEESQQLIRATFDRQSARLSR